MSFFGACRVYCLYVDEFVQWPVGQLLIAMCSWQTSEYGQGLVMCLQQTRVYGRGYSDMFTADYV